MEQYPGAADIAGIKQLRNTFSLTILAVLTMKSTVADKPVP